MKDEWEPTFGKYFPKGQCQAWKRTGPTSSDHCTHNKAHKGRHTFEEAST